MAQGFPETALTNVAAITVYLLPGMKIKLRERYYLPELDSIYHWNGNTYEERTDGILGFLVDDRTVGELTQASDEIAVVYTHRKAAENAIWFYSRTGEKAVCNISSVPIHDHSSIVQGGPSFGTYFNDDMVTEEEA